MPQAPTIDDIQSIPSQPGVGTLQLRINQPGPGEFRVGVWSSLGFMLVCPDPMPNLRLACAWGAYAMGIMTEHIDRHFGAHRP